MGAELDHSQREVLTQDKKQDNDDHESAEADIHMNLHRVADPQGGYLSTRQLAHLSIRICRRLCDSQRSVKCAAGKSARPEQVDFLTLAEQSTLIDNGQRPHGGPKVCLLLAQKIVPSTYATAQTSLSCGVVFERVKFCVKAIEFQQPAKSIRILTGAEPAPSVTIH